MIRARSKYGLPRWKKTRQAILDRDHHSCRICRSGDFLSVHHKDCDPTNDIPENLVTLCDRCHALMHSTVISPGYPQIHRKQGR
ncbi:MAG: HNH endonuclease [Methanoregulaceae archaeon]|nr:HNH endonuclease [Methanoregulaceae archaeon]